MGLNVLFMRAPPTFDPVVAVAVWHPGSEEGGRAAFKTIFDLEPVAVMGGSVEYAHLNDGLDPLCFKGA